MRRCTALVALLSIATPYPLAAQEGGVVRLELRDDPALEEGQIAIIRGVADAKGRRYSLSDVSILQPIAVTLLSLEEDPTLEMSLHVSRWEDAVRSTSLHGDVLRSLQFRTQGGVGIQVRAPDGRAQAFDLVAWVGDEIVPEMEPAVVSPDAYRRYAAANPELYASAPPEYSGGPGTSPVLVLIAVLLAGILVLLGILVFRR